MRDRIEMVFREVLGPMFQTDGGNIELVDIKDRLILVRFGGAYRGCPSAPYTLERIVTPALRAALGPDVRVEAVV